MGEEMELASAEASVMTTAEKRPWDDRKLMRVSAELTERFINARRLGDELLAEFQEIDALRVECEEQGLITAVEFTKPIHAALTAHRTGRTGSLEVPSFLLREPDDAPRRR